MTLRSIAFSVLLVGAFWRRGVLYAEGRSIIVTVVNFWRRYMLMAKGGRPR